MFAVTGNAANCECALHAGSVRHQPQELSNDAAGLATASTLAIGLGIPHKRRVC